MTRYGLAVVSDPEPCSEGPVVIPRQRAGRGLEESRLLQVAQDSSPNH